MSLLIFLFKKLLSKFLDKLRGFLYAHLFYSVKKYFFLAGNSIENDEYPNLFTEITYMLNISALVNYVYNQI